MNQNISVTFDLYSNQNPAIRMKQYDVGRTLTVKVTDCGKEFAFPSDATATFASGKIFTECEIENNRVIAHLPTHIEAGHQEAEIELFAGDFRLTTMTFSLIVEKSVRDDKAIIDEPDIGILEKLIVEVKALIADIIAKLKNGDFKGDKGDKGDKGEVGDTGQNGISINAENGQVAFQVENGDLLVYYDTDSPAPTQYRLEDGCLVIDIE